MFIKNTIIKNIGKKLKHNTGFTIIEIILTIAISGFIIIAVTSLFSSGFNIFDDIEEQTNNQKDLRFLTNYVAKNVRYANNVTIKDDFQTASNNLTSDEKIIGLENSAIKYQKYGSPTRIIINIPESTSIYFEKDNNDKITYLILNINGEKSKILLNNCDDVSDNSTISEPKSIVFE